MAVHILHYLCLFFYPLSLFLISTVSILDTLPYFPLLALFIVICHTLFCFCIYFAVFKIMHCLKQKCKHGDKLLKVSACFQGELIIVYRISGVKGTYIIGRDNRQRDFFIKKFSIKNILKKSKYLQISIQDSYAQRKMKLSFCDKSLRVRNN